MCPSMMSLSTLNVVRLFWFLAFFKTGNSSFLMSLRGELTKDSNAILCGASVVSKSDHMVEKKT